MFDAYLLGKHGLGIQAFAAFYIISVKNYLVLEYILL